MLGSGDGAGHLRDVVIIDDDEWVRRGRVHALEEHGGFTSVTGIDHTTALVWDADAWAGTDVAVVDAHEESDGWDRFVGVRVIRHLRQFRDPEQLRVIVITGHHGNELLQRRCADAGADWLFGHHQVRTAEQLVRAILHPGGEPLEPAPGGPDLDAALDEIQRGGAESVFDRSGPQKASGRSRRQIITLRRRLSRLLGHPEPRTVRELGDIVNRARGAGEPPTGP